MSVLDSTELENDTRRVSCDAANDASIQFTKPKKEKITKRELKSTFEGRNLRQGDHVLLRILPL